MKQEGKKAETIRLFARVGEKKGERQERIQQCTSKDHTDLFYKPYK